MGYSILTISERGQLTIPQKIRDAINVKHFVCTMENERIVLAPLKTKEEFLQELEGAEQDWEKHGGLTLVAMKKKHKL